MPVNQSQFDQDLANLMTNLTNYITAVNAFLALPPVIDLTNEDNTVQQGVQQIQTAQGQLPPPQPKPGA